MTLTMSLPVHELQDGFVASLSILIPVVIYFALGARAESAMTNAREWLIQNNKTVMAVLILVISASLIGDAVEILL